MTREDWRRSFWPWIRGTAIGFPIGALPAGGSEIPTFLSYALERRLSKHPEEFGHGAIEGVAGPEAANNAAAAGVLVPLLTLGLPTSATAAVLLAAFQNYNLQPGPFLFDNNPELVWGLIASLYVGNVMLLVLNLPLAGVWVRLLLIPRPYLYGGILIFAMVGVWGLSRSWIDLLCMFVIGLTGYAMRVYDFPIAPVLIGLILGPLAEKQLQAGARHRAGRSDGAGFHAACRDAAGLGPARPPPPLHHRPPEAGRGSRSGSTACPNLTMQQYRVRVHPSADRLPREDQLAWKIAEVAAGTRDLDDDVLEMIACRIVDNAGVALAAINRAPVAAARAMALAHPRAGGASLFGLPRHDPRRCRMGGLGQRHGGARARLPRHVPRRRLRASRRLHPAARRRRAADRAERRRSRRAASRSPTRSMSRW